MSNAKNPVRQMTVSIVEKYTPPGSTEEKSFWTDVGRAFAHRDGDGWSINLRANLAVMGTVVLREPRDADSAKTAPADKPADLVASVVERYTVDGEERSSWTDVGRAFPHSDGAGFNLIIRPGLSVHGSIVLRVPREDEQRPFR